ILNYALLNLSNQINKPPGADSGGKFFTVFTKSATSQAYE
ncbi:hypothetical protein DOY81_011425, partial [Sarcophaga bullata]